MENKKQQKHEEDGRRTKRADAPRVIGFSRPLSRRGVVRRVASRRVPSRRFVSRFWINEPNRRVERVVSVPRRRVGEGYAFS